MEWQAKWIWASGEERPRNLFLMFRRAFRAPGNVKAATLRITADSRYVLFINGERIGQGPPRSFPWRQNYDVYDVASYLRPGRNVVAVLVQHFGHSTFQYIEGRGGLLCQLDIETPRGTVTIGTDGSWRVSACEAFSRFVPRISVQQAWEEQFDARKWPEGWTDPDFDDSKWERAKEIGKPGCKPWTKLVERDIPFQTDDEVLPVRVMGVEVVRPIPFQLTIDLEAAFLPGTFDQNPKTIKGLLALEFEAERDETVVMRRAHHVWGRLKFNGEEVPDADGTRLRFVKGRNLLLFDVSGTHHLPQFSIGLDCRQRLRLRRALVIGPEEDQEALERIWEEGNLRGAPKDLTKPVPKEAIFYTDVWTKTAWDEPIKGANIKVDNPDALLTTSPDWTIIHPSPEGDVRILLDFGRELLAFTEFEVDAPRGAIIDFNFFEGIQEGRILLTSGLNNSMRYVCREGRQRYRSFVKRGFRYAWVVFRNFERPLKVRYISARMSTYPVPERGFFSCSDALLTKLWEVGRHTLRCCMDDTYLDCPAYEQTHWVGDARVEALVNWVVTGDRRITSHCLLQVADSLRRSPLPESHVPSGRKEILTAWALLWVISVREHWQFTGDRRFLRRIYPAVRTTCENFLNFLNEDGLLEIEAWNMLDWAPMDTPGRGVVAHQNMLLVRALREAADIAFALGERADARRWRERAKALVEAINRHLWSEERGAFVDCIREDGTQSPVISQQTNTMALLCDCVEGERAEKVRRLVYNPPEGVVEMGSPFFGFFLCEQMARDGRVEEMLRLFRERWGFMLEKGATTFWETFPGWEKDRWTRSWCHGWSSAPTYFLTTEVLGVKPAEPGFSLVEISPNPCGLKWAKGRVPTPYGEIEVEWHRTSGEGLDLSLTLPRGAKARLSLPVPERIKQLVVNGKPVALRRLPGGMKYLGRKEGRIVFLITRSGSWRVEVVGAVR